MGKRNRNYNGGGNPRCGYKDMNILCPRDYADTVRELVDKYEGIVCGTPKKVTGTKDVWVPLRVYNHVGSENLSSLRRDLKTEIGISI